MPKRDLTDFLLTYMGPAQVGNVRSRRRPTTSAQREREAELVAGYERVVGPDGREFLVERTETD
ncbi:hypothetical protein [Cellulomonas rhizosphaerae]|uniref:Uncharacterized protein n=1 Tax=Cellulomonas rhizosphaerae TaxID=2293719 RepID=A0A413RRE1_9CELL|nr:hypothetical protein [Cellulomonas rhizosphaerae]RHA44508.1 hypothetical protein D1825_00890 [Cellulomonas rhizosphaerae]